MNTLIVCHPSLCLDSQVMYFTIYNKTCLKWPLKMKAKIGFQDRLSLNAGQKYCRMLQECLQYFHPSLSYHTICYYFVYF